MRGEIYRKLGIKTLINARGYVTAYGGCLMSKETLNAMDEAATAFVLMTDLRAKVGQVIAKATGAEAGCISTGCSGGLVLAASACIAGTDRAKIERLPDTTGMKNEILVQANHYIRYINMLRMAGAKMVLYGYVDGGGGFGWTSPALLRGSITEKTAAIFQVEAWHGHHRGELPLKEVVKVSKEMEIPVIVDAADEWDFRKNITEGADLVVHSGGKWVLGPQSTGIIAGRKDLIRACEAQDSLGRPLKVQKEEMVGLIVALEAYMKRDWDAYWKASEARHERVRRALSDIPHVKLEIIHKDERRCRICQLKLQLDEEALGMTAFEVNEKLIKRDPPVRIREHYAYLGELGIWLDFMPEEDEEILIQALRDVLTSR